MEAKSSSVESLVTIMLGIFSSSSESYRGADIKMSGISLAILYLVKLMISVSVQYELSFKTD